MHIYIILIALIMSYYACVFINMYACLCHVYMYKYEPVHLSVFIYIDI
jgi:hypothetical protein